RHDAFQAELAGVGEDGRAVALHVFVVLLDQVEGVEEYALVSALVTDEIKRGNAIVVAGDSFAVDDAGARARARQRLNDQREAMGEVIAWTTIEPHLRASLAGNDAEAVMLDLMQPLAAGRQLIGFGWKARRNEPGRQGTLQHAETNRIGRGDCKH